MSVTFPSLLTALIDNFGMLLATTFVYSLARSSLNRASSRLRAVLTGILFGVFAATATLTPVETHEGFRFDARNAMVVLATVYGGPVAGLVATGLVVPVRWALGGAGAMTAAFSLLSVVAVSAWFRQRYGYKGRLWPHQIAVLGFVTTLIGLLWVRVTPSEAAASTLDLLFVPALVANTLAIALVAGLLAFQKLQLYQQTELVFTRIGDASLQLFWVLDMRLQQVVYANPALAKMLGRTVSELLGAPESFFAVVHPDDRERVTEAVMNCSEVSGQADFRMIVPDGGVRWLSAKLTAVRDERDRVIRVVVGADDVTERKEANQRQLQLVMEQERSAMLHQFIANASHDLRTPITTMHTSLYLLERKLETDDQRQYADRIQDELKRMTRLIEDMLKLSNLDNPDKAVTLMPRPLNQIVDSVCEQRKPDADSRGRRLVLALAADELCVNADADQLAEAIDRIVWNAISYTRAGDEISVSTFLRGDDVVIEVSDTGVGIAPQDLSHVFERFYRADKARGTDAGGAGLGLPIARRIMQLHDGAIEVESVPEQGSTFRLVLPAVPQQAAAAILQI